MFTSLIHGNKWSMTCWEIKPAISNLLTDLTVGDYFLLQHSQPGDTHKRRARVSTSPPDVFCPCSPLAWLPAYLPTPSRDSLSMTFSSSCCIFQPIPFPPEHTQFISILHSVRISTDFSTCLEQLRQEVDAGCTKICPKKGCKSRCCFHRHRADSTEASWDEPLLTSAWGFKKSGL